VELHAAEGDDPGVLEISAHGARLGFARLALAGPEASLGVAIDAGSPFERVDIAAVLVALVQRAAAHGARTVVLDSHSLLVRHEARRIGFVGPLRHPLHVDVGGSVGPGGGGGPDVGGSVGRGANDDDSSTPVTGARAPGGGGGRSDGTAVPDGPGDAGAPGTSHRLEERARASSLAGALAAWGLVAEAARPPRSLGRVAKRLSLGVADSLDLVVTWAPGRTVVVGCPDRPDLMPEAVAMAAETTGAVLRRFPEQAGAVRSIRFDRSSRGLTTGHYGGVADRSAGTIHLNIGYVAADAMVDMTRRRAEPAERGGASAAERATYGDRRPSAGPLAPYTVVDTTMAHELWHHIENAFESRHYADSIALRRGLGEMLGVETLERAVKGSESNAPDAWKMALQRLAYEVSPYATTNANEATAEMFKLWWCRVGPLSPVVARFGELIDQLIPPSPS